MSVTDARSTLGLVARWDPGTKERLRDAALARFAANGYVATSVEEVARDAGVTERTFFRHFPDKEEVLFDEDDVLLAVLLSGLRDHIATSPADEPVVAARAAVRRLATEFDRDRRRHRQRAEVLASSTALTSRQLLKEQRWTAALASELVAKGVERRRAAAAAALAGIGLRLAYAEWTGSARGARLLTLLDSYEAEIDLGCAGRDHEA